MRNLKISILCGMLTVAGAAKADTTLHVISNDANNGASAQHTITLDTKIMIGTEKLTVKSGSKQAAYDLSTLRALHLKSGESSLGAVAAEAAYSLEQAVVSHTLAITGPVSAKGTPVKVFSTTGMCVLSVDAWKGETLNVAGLVNGAYIAVIENQPLKFVKK